MAEASTLAPQRCTRVDGGSREQRRGGGDQAVEGKQPGLQHRLKEPGQGRAAGTGRRAGSGAGCLAACCGLVLPGFGLPRLSTSSLVIKDVLTLKA